MKNLIAIFVILPALVGASERRHWVFFRDKGVYTKFDIARLSEGYPQECVRRRARVGVSFDESDLPVFEEYIRSVEQAGGRIHTVSKWLNAVSINASPEVLAQIETFPFVRKITPVGWFYRGSPEEPVSAMPLRVDSIYGVSYNQLKSLDIPTLHYFGYTGRGIRIGVFDTGFNLQHRCFQRVNIIAAYDFVNNDTIVHNEPGVDAESQHNHGTMVLSLIAGYEPGYFIGGAYGADFILAKTEDISSETPLEEDNWIRAGEWAESLGVDIVTSSLGYWDWYVPSQMDGRTATITVGALRLARLGVLVCTANGNSGPGPVSIVAPADADSVISVGAIDMDDSVAVFSSRGPTADGRIKPDLVAPGVYVAVALPTGPSDYLLGSGTSFATPIMASLCALILQIHPDWQPMRVIEELKRTSTFTEEPNNDYGWGKPNAIFGSAREDSATYIYFLHQGWNLVSFPVYVRDGFRFPAQIGGFYAYNGRAYEEMDTLLVVGAGYFVLMERDTVVRVSGEPFRSVSILLHRGWNLIGGDISYHDERRVGINPRSAIYPGSLYLYDALEKRYRPAKGTGPTRGYWVLLNGDAVYMLGR